MKAYAENKKAYFDYEILETFEAGIALKGYEVKSIKTGHINLAGAFAILRGNELYLLNAYIAPYQIKNMPVNYEPTQSRKLLLKKSEIKYLIGKIKERGLTLVPISVYNKKGLIKVKLGLARHKKKQDKREVIRKREAEREMRRNIKI